MHSAKEECLGNIARKKEKSADLVAGALRVVLMGDNGKVKKVAYIFHDGDIVR